MNTKRKLCLQLPAGIATLLRQVTTRFVQGHAVAIGEWAEEQIRSSCVLITCWSEGLSHLAASACAFPTACLTNEIYPHQVPQHRRGNGARPILMRQSLVDAPTLQADVIYQNEVASAFLG